MSDGTDSNVVHLPARGSDSGGMPDAPDGGDLFYSEPPDSDPGSVVPLETRTEFPHVRGPISPEAALRESGIAETPDPEEPDEYEEGEYEIPRSLADRLGDWLEYRLEVVRDRHAGEAPFREAEIARKVALVEARTAQETAMMEQNSKLHTAMMKAKSDKAVARSSSSGMGADKGRSKAGGGGGSGRNGGGRGSGTNQSGTGSGRGSGAGNSPKGTGKGSDRFSGSRKGGPKGTGPSGGSRGRQNGSGGGNSGGSGNFGSGKGGSKGDSAKTSNSSASSPAQERAGGRQVRATARQAARQQRRSAGQAANLADRSKDRAANQAAREKYRAAKAERKAARLAKRDAAKANDDRTTLGAAVVAEAQRRWDKRRADAKDKAAGAADTDGNATTEKMPKGGPETAAAGPKGDPASRQPKNDGKDGEKPSNDPADKAAAKDGTGADDGPKTPPDAGGSGDERSFKERLKDFFTKAGEDTAPPEQEESSRLRPEDLGDVRVDRPGAPTRSPQSESSEEDIEDAVIVNDPADPFGAHLTSPASLPRAPEPHTQRPDTNQPTAQEEPMASQVRKPSTGQTGVAAQHRTDITFGEYLTEIVNIAIAAALDKNSAQELAVALGTVADALRDMAADLVGDHNIATDIVGQITDLADAAMRMKQLAERCATECEVAYEAARIAATSVGRTYGQDIAAMDDAGLTHASAAAHHD